MSSVEFVRWQVFAEKYPFLTDRSDVHAAMVVAMLAAVNSKDARYEPSKFLPTWGGKEAMSEEDQLAAVERLNAMFGGKDSR
jgi:hypothetical protein